MPIYIHILYTKLELNRMSCLVPCIPLFLFLSHSLSLSLALFHACLNISEQIIIYMYVCVPPIKIKRSQRLFRDAELKSMVCDSSDENTDQSDYELDMADRLQVYTIIMTNGAPQIFTHFIISYHSIFGYIQIHICMIIFLMNFEFVPKLI